MENSSQRVKMKEQIQSISTSTALISSTKGDPRAPPDQTPLSYFLNITIPQPSIRVKIPKFLVKTIQKRSHGCCSNANNSSNGYPSESKSKSKWTEPTKLFKVGLIFSTVFGQKKPSSYLKVHQSGNANAGMLDSSSDPLSFTFPSALIPTQFHSSLVNRSNESTSICHRLGSKDSEPMENASEGMRRSSDEVDKPLQTSSLENNKGSYDNKDCSGSRKDDDDDDANDDEEEEDNDKADGVAARLGMIGRLRKGLSWLMMRKFSRKTMGKSSEGDSEHENDRGKKEEEEDEDEDKDGNELCKKRILMGVKCKPIDFSVDC